MLTKNDLEQIDSILHKRLDNAIKKMMKSIIDRSIQSSFENFYDHIFEPFVNRNEAHHQEIVKEIKKLQNREEEQDDYLKDHDKRIEYLEKLPRVKN